MRNEDLNPIGLEKKIDCWIFISLNLVGFKQGCFATRLYHVKSLSEAQIMINPLVWYSYNIQDMNNDESKFKWRWYAD